MFQHCELNLKCTSSGMQVDAEALDASIVNLDKHLELQLHMGGVLPREAERLSLTVRRVLRVQRSLLRL